MSLWAIIPVKPLTRGKSRLAGVLSAKERAALNQRMLTNTLQSLDGIIQDNQVLVVSRDPKALALAREFGFLTVREESTAPELNVALTRAAAAARMRGATALLVIPADLPLVDADSLKEFLSNAPKAPGLVINPDRRHEGTNALWISPPDLINFQYGPQSFHLHTGQARAKNAHVAVVELSVLGLDLDLPDDLLELEKIAPSFVVH